MTDTYDEWAPRGPCAAVVRCLWRFQSDGENDRPQRIAPDGCPELIVHLGAAYAENDGPQQPAILFAGQLTRPLTLAACGPVHVFGLRFEPGGARAFLGRPLADATDQRVDLRVLHGQPAHDLLNDVLTARDWDARRAVAEQYVAARGVDRVAEVDAAVARLAEGGELEATRQMQRLFAEHVGVPPRKLASIFRFRRVFDAIERPEAPGWVEAALAAGYFDQPQMARDFRRFLGCTATAWAREKAGLAHALALSQSYKNEGVAAGKDGDVTG